MTLPLAGGDPLVLTTGEARDASPAWSPDGSHIAFGSDRGGALGVWTMTTDGRNLSQVTAKGVHSNRLVVWTPDGAIAWQQRTPGNFLNWWRRDFATGREASLAPTITTGYLFEPVFSPRRGDLAVHWNQARRGLYVLLLAGEPRFVASDLAPIAWSADGEFIYARLPLGASEIFAVSAKTGEVRSLLKLSEGTVGVGDITPDRRYLVLEALRFSGDAWLVEDFDPRVQRSAAR